MASKRPQVTRSAPGRVPGRVWGRSGRKRAAGRQSDRMGSKLPAVVCAWCKRVIRKGTKPVTHGICRSCAAAEFPDGDVDRNPPPRAILVRKFRSASGHLVSGDVDAISYVHVGSASLKPYRHEFAGTDTELWALSDGSLLVRNPRARLWEDMLVEDDE